MGRKESNQTKFCVTGAKILRPPGTLSSSQGSQQDINSAIIQVDPQEGIIQSQEGKTQSYGQSEVGSGEPARGSSVSPLKRKLDYDEQFKDLKRQKKGLYFDIKKSFYLIELSLLTFIR